MVEYELRSMPGVVIEVPADYAKAAEEIVGRATREEEATRDDRLLSLGSLVKKLGSLGYDKRVSLAAMQLGGVSANNEEYPALSDRLYLEVCMYEAGQRGSSAQLRTISRVLFEIMRLVSAQERPQEEASPETFRESMKTHLDDCVD